MLTKPTTKMKVIMLPSTKESPLCKDIKYLDLQLAKHYDTMEYPQYQHLYVISNDNIERGDWYVSKHTAAVEGGYIYFVNKSNGALGNDVLGKIIGTTSNLKIYKETYEFGSPQVEDYIPQLSQTFIEEYVNSYNDGKRITEVYVELACGNKLPECIPNAGCTYPVIKLSKDHEIIIYSTEQPKDVSNISKEIKTEDNVKKYSLPLYENGIKTKFTVDFEEGDDKWKILMNIHNEIPLLINVKIKEDDKRN